MRPHCRPRVHAAPAMITVDLSLTIADICPSPAKPGRRVPSLRPCGAHRSLYAPVIPYRNDRYPAVLTRD